MNSTSVGSRINNNPAPCRYFQLGRCHFGERCRYLHLPTDRGHTETVVSNDENVTVVDQMATNDFIRRIRQLTHRAIARLRDDSADEDEDDEWTSMTEEVAPNIERVPHPNNPPTHPAEPVTGDGKHRFGDYVDW